MLDAFIIEEIKRREQEEDRRGDERRPRLDIPVEPEHPLVPSGEEKPDRGVVIIDYSVEREGEGDQVEDLIGPPLGRLPFDRPVVPV